MIKDICTFLVGLVAGAILGLLVRDKDKQRVKNAITDQFNDIRKKYEELSQEGKELFSDQLNRMVGKYNEGKGLVKEGLENVKNKI